MLQFQTLRSRLLVLVTVPLVGFLGSLLWISHRTTTEVVERAAEERLGNAESVLRELVESRRRALLAQARVTAADPRFFATFSVPDAERGAEFVRTMELLARDFLDITDADFIEVHDRRGAPLLRVDRDGAAAPGADTTGRGQASLLAATRRAVSTDLFLGDEGAVLVADAPVFLGRRQEAVLRMGLDLDEDFALEVRRLTGADLAIGEAGRVAVSTWSVPPGPVVGAIGPESSATAGGVQRLEADGEEFLCMAARFEGIGSDSGFTALLGRSTGTQLAPLHRAERLMVAIGIAVLVVAILAGIWIAVGVTRPLHALVHFAERIREGDYSNPVPQSGRDEVGLLAHALEESRQALQAHVRRLEDLDRRRGEFLTLAGHELRTPLTVITSFNDMLHEGVLGELPPEVLETTAVISGQLRQLNEQVNDILDLTALEAAPDKAISVERVDLTQVIDRVNREQGEVRGDREVEVHWRRPDLPMAVPGDERLLGRAVRAVLDNAVRFTPDGGRVDVTLVRAGDELHLEIADDGIGIDPEDLRWIYDKLFEGGSIENHSSGRLEFQSGGMGLGLSITRAVVRAHGGRLEVESEPGQGSSFRIVLPSSPTPVPTIDSPSEEVPC